MIRVTIPFTGSSMVRELLDATPGISYEERRGVLTEFRITGPAEDLASLAPTLAQVENEFASKEAW